MKSKKALVIGSEGNIGKPLVKYLKSLDYKVLRVDQKPNSDVDYLMADIRNSSDMLSAFDWKPDIVFHLAAMVSRVTCEQASSLAIDVNLSGTQNVLDLTKRINAHLVYFSTSEVYGPDASVMSEDVLPCPNNRYGLSKLLSESLVEYEVEQYGLSAVILRPFMMYDEEEDLGEHRSAMIRFATNLISNKPIQVHKGSVRGWLHVSDAVRAIEAAANIKKYSVINIGNPDIRPIEELAEMIRIACGANKDLIEIVELPSRMTLIKKPTLEKQTNLLKVIPQISLEKGIELVCDRVKNRLSLK